MWVIHTRRTYVILTGTRVLSTVHDNDSWMMSANLYTPFDCHFLSSMFRKQQVQLRFLHHSPITKQTKRKKTKPGTRVSSTSNEVASTKKSKETYEHGKDIPIDKVSVKK